MPAQSKSQQRFFGVVKAMQKGDIPKKGKAGKIAKTMDKDDVDDFASTKHKGKPEKVKREQRFRNLIKKMVREELNKMNENSDTFVNILNKFGFKAWSGYFTWSPRPSIIFFSAPCPSKRLRVAASLSKVLGC